MKYLTTGHLRELLGVSPEQIHRWVKLGIVRPTVQGHGSGQHHAFSVTDALAVMIGRELRRRGISLKLSGDAMEWLLNRSLDELQARFAEGRTCLLLAGKDILPRLIDPNAIDEADLVAAHLKAVPVAIVNVAGCLQRITEFVEQRHERDHQEAQAR